MLLVFEEGAKDVRARHRERLGREREREEREMITVCEAVMEDTIKEEEEGDDKRDGREVNVHLHEEEERKQEEETRGGEQREKEEGGGGGGGGVGPSPHAFKPVHALGKGSGNQREALLAARYGNDTNRDMRQEYIVIVRRVLGEVVLVSYKANTKRERE